MSLVDRLKQKGIEVIENEPFLFGHFQQLYQQLATQTCPHFDPQEIQARFKQLIQSDEELSSLDWGQCRFAAYESSQRLDGLLHPYAPTYCALFAQGNVNGGPSGHVWLATEVCGQTYITDIVGAGFYAKNFGFGPHYFDNDRIPFEEGYHDFAITTAHCSDQPLDIEDDDNAYSAMDKAQDKLDDARERAGTLTLWESFVRWLRS
ncbi:MAG: hypothetical protein ACD_73C00440G0005 [uncultured bacterium]|nr:MAG: hypothetical protein ACD_73C00440G0005 [uncultured bacterium]